MLRYVTLRLQRRITYRNNKPGTGTYSTYCMADVTDPQPRTLVTLVPKLCVERGRSSAALSLSARGNSPLLRRRPGAALPSCACRLIVCLLDAAGPIEHAIARESTLCVERHERAPGCRADVVVRRVRAARLGLARLLGCGGVARRTVKCGH